MVERKFSRFLRVLRKKLFFRKVISQQKWGRSEPVF